MSRSYTPFLAVPVVRSEAGVCSPYRVEGVVVLLLVTLPSHYGHDEGTIDSPGVVCGLLPDYQPAGGGHALWHDHPGEPLFPRVAGFLSVGPGEAGEPYRR